MIKKCLGLSIKMLVIAKILFIVAIAKEPTIFVEGEHFKKISSAHKDLTQLRTTIDEGSVNHQNPEIIIFFNYGCYGCWLLHKEFDQWLKSHSKIHVSVKYYPGSFNDAWYKLAKLYYVNKELNVYTDLEIFNQIHGEPGKALWLESEMINFYAKKNINQDRFLQLFNSFHILRKTNNTIEISNIYNINITPNIIVNVNNDSYMVNLTMVNDIKSLLRVIEYLLSLNSYTDKTNN